MTPANSTDSWYKTRSIPFNLHRSSQEVSPGARSAQLFLAMLYLKSGRRRKWSVIEALTPSTIPHPNLLSFRYLMSSNDNKQRPWLLKEHHARHERLLTLPRVLAKAIRNGRALCLHQSPMHHYFRPCHNPLPQCRSLHVIPM